MGDMIPKMQGNMYSRPFHISFSPPSKHIFVSIEQYNTTPLTCLFEFSNNHIYVKRRRQKPENIPPDPTHTHTHTIHVHSWLKRKKRLQNAMCSQKLYQEILTKLLTSVVIRLGVFVFPGSNTAAYDQQHCKAENWTDVPFGPHYN